MAIKMSNLALNMLLAVAGGEEPQPVLDNIIYYNSTVDICKQDERRKWIQKNTYIDYNSYDDNTGNGVLYLKPNVKTIGGVNEISPFYNNGYVVSVNFANSAITEIGTYAFGMCTALTKLELGYKTTMFGYDAFYYCTNLSQVMYYSDIDSWCNIEFAASTSNPLQYGAELWVYNSIGNLFKVRNATISSENIKQYAFYGSELIGVKLEPSVKYIYIDAFRECKLLKTVQYNGYFENWLGIYFETKYSNPCALALCAPSGLTDDKIDFTNPVIPDKVTTIKQYAMVGWNKIINWEALGRSKITTIEKGAFADCISLANCTLPKSVENIGSGIFNGCSKLQSLMLPFVGASRNPVAYSSESELGYIFGRTSYEKATQVYQPYIVNDSVYYYDYYIPISLKTVTVFDATKIGYGAFYNCTMLTTINITRSDLDLIEEDAFAGCQNVTNIILPASLQEIQAHAFATSKYNQTPCGITTVSCYALTPPTLGSSNFTNSGDTLYVVLNSLEAYTADSSWSSAFTTIEAIK